MSEALTVSGQVAGVVLAGGRSRRMGRDKALLELGGETLLARMLRLLAPCTAERLVVGRDGHELDVTGVRTVPDAYPGEGPLAGLATALRAMRSERAFVVACDMPLLQPALMRFLISLAHNADAVVPRSATGLEPLHAVYSRQCLLAAEACLRDGERAVSTLFARVRIRIVEPVEWTPYDPEGRSFLNANTPDEWQRIVALVATPRA